MAKTETNVLALLPVLSLIFGCLEYGPLRGPERGSVPLTVHAIVSLVVVYAWFWIDARRRSYKASVVLRAAMLVVTVVALPYYLFRSRGFVGGMKGLASSVLVFALTMAAYRVGSFFA
jgi:hypothetical protein